MTAFSGRLRDHPGPVAVDFWAPWCGACRTMAPKLDAVGEEYRGRVAVWKVNVDTEPEVAAGVAVRGTPTVVAFVNGRELNRLVGAASTSQLRALFEQVESGRAARIGGSRSARAVRVLTAVGLLALGWSTGAGVLYVAACLVLLLATYDLLVAALRSNQ